MLLLPSRSILMPAVGVAVLAALLAGIAYLLVRHEMRRPIDVASLRARYGPAGPARKASWSGSEAVRASWSGSEAVRASWSGSEAVRAIPKRIWTYWEGPDSGMVKECMERCRRLNPGYTLTVLNPGNVREHIPELPEELLSHLAFNDLPARKADLIRCFAIAYHGGIWMDASVVCLRPFADWLDHDAEFVGFALRRNTTLPQYPMLENWFFASRPGCRFMEEWCWEFARLAEFGFGGAYASYVSRAGVDMQNIPWYARAYLAMHCAAQRVMQQVVPPAGLRITYAEDGPMAHMVAPGVNWNARRGVMYVTDRWDEMARTVPFVKFTRHERKALREMDGAERERFMARLRGP